MQCSRCSEKAIYEVRYNSSSLCRTHFNQFVEKRVKKEIRNQLKRNGKPLVISVAISGGKDSSVTLYLLNKIFGKDRKIKLMPFTVDEGISGYRDSGIEKARELCHDLGLEHHIISFSESYGKRLEDIVADDRTNTIPCSHCGPMRRNLMNKISKLNFSDYVALGINLDDYAQSILMNVVKGDLKRLARMAPHDLIRDTLVPRILPLRKIPENEVMLYAVVNGIKFDSGWCPFYERAQRNKFRHIIAELEESTPGSRHALVRFHDELKPVLADSVKHEELGKCRICGSPTANEVCAVCSDLSEMNFT
ncbi:MAG: TIGR00269 family protein [Thermoplasmataceae archaeon]